MFKLFEFVQSNQLVRGKKYFIKNIENLNDYDHDNSNFDSTGIFDGYNEVFRNYLWFKFGTFYDLIQINNNFYRVISEEEYYSKLKEKYDTTCLNIILKRLINENFEWV